MLTISDTRTDDFDVSGKLAVELLAAAGHDVTKEIIRDEPEDVLRVVREWIAGGEVDVVITNGGTGIAKRDTTIEALDSLFDKKLDGFGELFRMLSFAEIGAAAMLSRATAGTVGKCIVFALPGSPSAVRLGVEKLIAPEIGHILSLLRG